jgi:hypothetical protein
VIVGLPCPDRPPSVVITKRSNLGPQLVPDIDNLGNCDIVATSRLRIKADRNAADTAAVLLRSVAP